MAAEQQPAKAGSSRFAVTCSLLRQFMKEQGGNGARCLAPAVAMSLMPGTDVVGGGAEAEAEAVAPEERKTVLKLFPQQACTLKVSEERREPERAPLTIFYGGRMVVFDDFPADKAEELMQLAGSGNVAPAASAAGQNALGQPCLPDMPIARKASLQRFLEKRKNRLAAVDPYPAANWSTKHVKGDAAPWLGVNSRLSLS
ncbi:protein TIFY 11c-like isoform X2 [Phragmites australis]|uniref:protein TIFY 11c-like isoform X2 n=1 Tax=Phragmites australis TaxID=29695 RepID=UPI002D77804E|nr:protein TIFY 11c-like isoform X2 [Phragmites australis]